VHGKIRDRVKKRQSQLTSESALAALKKDGGYKQYELSHICAYLIFIAVRLLVIPRHVHNS
jgi:hypothetical protein